jgi:hypothetical protein
MSAIWTDDLNSVEEIIDFLVKHSSEKLKEDASHDAILVLDFFPRLGIEFHTSPDFSEDQVNKFKEEFDYERYGLDRELALKKIEKYRSIDRILDTLVKMLPANVKDDLMQRYLLEVWFKQNSKGDLEHFKSSLKRDYWLK